MKRDVSIIVLVDTENRILLQYRDEKAKRFALEWGFFGGGMKEGETPEQTLYREIKEELAYTPYSPKLIWQQEYTIPELGESGTEYVFLEKYDGSPLNLSEGGSMQWCTLDEATALPLNTVDRRVVSFLIGLKNTRD